LVVFSLSVEQNIASASGASSHISSLPEGFVYIKNLVPEVVLSIRYATPYNFLGRLVNGYKAPEAILTKAAALAT
jgi:D-alanyl-D-alanine dipeptidase